MDNANKNLKLYGMLEKVPQEARTTIEGGNLKGKTSINTMWRIKKMTEIFGPCGTGWFIEVKKQWTEIVSESKVMAFVNIDLYVKNPETGEWSKPIHGTGGNQLISQDRSGNVHGNDDAYKMAESDALSNACKKLGLGAEVYYENDYSKYTCQNNAERVQTVQTVQQVSTAKPELNELSPNWKASIAKAASLNEKPENIRKMIERIYRIDDTNFRKLMKVAGKEHLMVN